MTSYEFGDVVLVWFPQSETPRPKRRPALVIADTADRDAVFAPITSVERTGAGDMPLTDWTNAGLVRPSWVRLGKVASLQQEMVERRLGSISNLDRAQIIDIWHGLYRF